MIQFDPRTLDECPIDDGCTVTRADFPSGIRLLTVELPFGVSRSVPARSHPNGQPSLWLSEGETIVGDEEYVIRVLTNRLVSEILSVEARRGKQESASA